MDWHARLATLAAWQATHDDDRTAALAAIVVALGDGWTPGRLRVGRCGLGEVAHVEHGGFVVVPGGWLRMGFSCDDLLAAARARDDGSTGRSFGWQPTAARPTRWVRMRPMLLAIAGMAPGEEEPASDGGAASEAYRAAVEATRSGSPGPTAQELVDAYDGRGEPGAEPPMRIVTPDEAAAVVPAGFRLPSEAELEWALREGGTTRWIGVAPDVEVTAANRRDVLLGTLDNGFGLLGLRDLQNLCADGAVNYDGDSPIEPDAVATDREQRIARWAHTYWQDDDVELLGVHAAHRAAPDEYGQSIVRLARDLPDARGPEGDPPDALAEHAATIAALAEASPRARADALSALAYLAVGPGDDVAATATAILDALPTVDAPTRAALLVWLADAQLGGHREHTIKAPERKRRDALGADRAAVRAAVAEASESIAAFLDDADPDVRSAAALALTFCVDASANAKAALAARLGREATIGVQVALILALIRLGAGFRAPAMEPEIRAAIAVATAVDGAVNLDGLLAASQLPPVPHLAWNGGRLDGVAIGFLAAADDDTRAAAAVVIAERAVADADDRLASVVMTMAFGPRPKEPRPPRLVEELSSTERQVLTKLIGFDRAIDWRSYGFAPTVDGRRRYLGFDEAGPTDRFVPHGDGEVPLWFVVRTLVATEGWPAARARTAELLAGLTAGDRLALYLDHRTHGLDGAFDHDGLAALLDEVAADPGARAAVDAFTALPTTSGRGRDWLRAVVATRAGEPLPPDYLAMIEGTAFGDDVAVLRGFAPAVVEARLLSLLAPVLADALTADDWVIGLEHDLERWAGALAVAASARAARQLLLLGWASGQPALVRAAVGAAGAAHPAIAAVLAEYDTLPTFTSWPRARAVLPTYAT